MFYVLVFKTRLYDEQRGKENQQDYEHFINCVGGQLLGQGIPRGPAHELELDGKRLTCIYDYIEA